MLSLDNSYNIDELRAFGERCQKLAEGRKLEYVAELKIDGLSLSLQYEDGLLVRGVTRGDGRIGEDVTQNARTIRSVPLRLKAKPIDTAIEVRGEVFIPRDVFDRTNAEREEAGEPRFANPRNAAAGAIRQRRSRRTRPRARNSSENHVRYRRSAGPSTTRLCLPTTILHRSSAP